MLARECGAAATDVTAAGIEGRAGGSLRCGSIGGQSAITVTFHGVRGSTPCHGDDIQRYGGNTSCVSVGVPGEGPIVFDLGTGLRYFGASTPRDQPFRGTCLLTHLHWDHTQGLPFFTPLLDPGSELDVYAPAQADGRLVGSVMREMIHPPAFPVRIDDIPGAIRFHDLGDADFDLGAVRVSSRLVPHVGNTLGYRIEWGGRSIAYISDHQQPYDGGLAATEGALELARNVDLLIHDAQYTDEEFALKYNWGHCTVGYAVWFATAAQARTLALFHHDPTRDDDAVERLGARAAADGARDGLSVIIAREGMTVEI